MRKSESAEKIKKRNNRRKQFRIVFEIVLMTLGVLCSIMPYPFPLLVPIGIGTVRIITQAVRKDTAEPAAPPVVYCNGAQEPKPVPKKKATKATQRKKRK